MSVNTTPTLLRTSPLDDRLQTLNGSWRDINGMPSLVSRPDDAAIAAQLGIADLSCLTRFGVKGARAAEWLAQQNISIPDRPNSWQSLPNGGLIARLGRSEFLIEDGLPEDGSPQAIALQLAQTSQHSPAQVYPVLRQDAAIALCGVAVDDLLRQTCNINFRSLPLSDYPVILTSMAGVSVTVIPSERSNRPFYRIWCDGTFGAYLWRSLLAIAEELGGGAVGIDAISRL